MGIGRIRRARVVSWWCVEEIHKDDYTRPVTGAEMEEAKEKIVRERGTHLDSLMERMKEPRVSPRHFHKRTNLCYNKSMEFNYLVGHTLADDAWKDDHSGASAEKSSRGQAYKLGVNVMFGAGNQYYLRHYEQ